MTAARFLRRSVQIGLGLVLLWVGAVFWLGLLYWAVPPVSTLMLGRWLTLQPVERTFVSLDEIAPSLPLAVLTAEDSRFCEHNGVDWDALRDVVEAADEDGPARGASTLSMQVAKNLFLWPSRSYIRKGLVHRGTAPAQIVVVHGGQVVMHQGIAVQELDRATGP